MGITSKCSDLIGILKQITVEPFLFFFIFGYAVRQVTFQDLLVYRSCQLVLKYPEETCSNLEQYETERDATQKIGNNLYVGYVMVSTLPAVVIATFVGPWSDKYGRLIPLICACVGTLCDSIITTIISSFPNIMPSYYLIPAILSGLSGGFITSLSSCYSYMSDITDEGSRQSRFAVLEFFYILATPLATVIGGQLFDYGGYTYVLAAAPVSYGCALAWAVLFLKESRQRQLGATGMKMLQDIFHLDNVKDVIKTSVSKRSGNVRLQIWLLIFAGCCIRLVELGSLAIGYYYSKKMYLWGVSTYSNALTIFHVCTALITLTIIPFFSKTLEVHEAAVGLVGVLSLMAKMLLLCVAQEEWLFFYAWFAGLLQAAGRIAVRSRLSKLVSKKEQGRIFSLLATFEALTPVLGMLMFSQIYNASLGVYPGMPYLVAGIALIPSAAIFGWMTRMPTTVFVELEESGESEHVKELKEVASDSMEKH